jgi:hypothetical protein
MAAPCDAASPPETEALLASILLKDSSPDQQGRPVPMPNAGLHAVRHVGSTGEAGVAPGVFGCPRKNNLEKWPPEYMMQRIERAESVC